MTTTALQENKDLVRRANDRLNEQSREAFVTHHSEDLVLHVANEEIHGLDAAVEREEAIWEGFPDLHHTLDDILAEGDEVAYRFTAAGTHDGVFQGIEPTRREVTITGQGLVRVENEEIAEVWLNYDSLGMLQQIGIIDLPSA